MPGRTNYRKIYENFYGPIPKDGDGRTYEIHHIDGNRNNNAAENLIALTIDEHYNIHFKQGDWAACQSIAIRMNTHPSLLSELASLANKRKVNDGSHNFIGGNIARASSRRRVEEGTHHFIGGDQQKKLARRRVEEGTHHFIGGGIQQALAKLRVKSGTHHFSGSDFNNKRKQEGTHPAQILYLCPHCSKEGRGGGMKRFHFENCKDKK